MKLWKPSLLCKNTVLDNFQNSKKNIKEFTIQDFIEIFQSLQNNLHSTDKNCRG